MTNEEELQALREENRLLKALVAELLPLKEQLAQANARIQALFELLDPGIRLGQLLFQRQQFRYQRFEKAIFFSQGLQFFFVRHSCTLVGFLSFGKSVGDLSSYKRFMKSLSPVRQSYRPLRHIHAGTS